jgi:hypothetical protein
MVWVVVMGSLLSKYRDYVVGCVGSPVTVYR